MNRQLPGYYYDEEKKKYFKIQPNYTVPVGSAYSADQVKRRKVELETASEEARDVQRQQGLVRRAEILRNSLLGGSLAREQGYGHPSDYSARTYVEGWKSTNVLASEASPSLGPQTRTTAGALNRPEPIHPPAQREVQTHINISTVVMGAIEYDPDTCSLFYPLNGGTLCMNAERNYEPQEEEALIPLYSRRGALQLATNSTPITSITMDPKTKLVLATWQAPDMGHNVHLVKLDGESVGVSRFAGNSLYHHGRHPSDLLGTSISSRMWSNIDRTTTIWSAAHGCQGSPFAFVVGTDDGLITVDERGNLYIMADQPSAVLAVDCLPQHPFVAIAGLRNGSIGFLDFRDRMPVHFSDIETIHHPSTVTHIKQSSDHIITVAGLHSTLCNYDLRFIQLRPRVQAWPHWEQKGTRGQGVVRNYVSNPLVVYPEHHNSAHVELGFDIDIDASLVAAAQSDELRTISIFSIKTGEVIRSLHIKDAHAESVCDSANVKALKFVLDGGHEHMKSLWIAKGTRIVRFAW